MSRRCCAAECFNSSTTNKDLTFFGFPKSEEGYRWARLAGRDDLTEKPLTNLNKYYLCAAHFTDECFNDPETKTKLKKRTRPPQNYPMPTIFKSNFIDFLPAGLSANLKKGSGGEGGAVVHPSPPKATKRKETSPKKPLVKRVHLASAEGNQEFELRELLEEFVEVDFKADVCRLCASNSSDDKMLPIFEETGVVHGTIDQLLPAQITEYDGKPQTVCVECFEKAKDCVDTILKFQENQEKF